MSMLSTPTPAPVIVVGDIHVRVFSSFDGGYEELTKCVSFLPRASGEANAISALVDLVRRSTNGKVFIDDKNVKFSVADKASFGWFVQKDGSYAFCIQPSSEC